MEKLQKVKKEKGEKCKRMKEYNKKIKELQLNEYLQNHSKANTVPNLGTVSQCNNKTLPQNRCKTVTSKNNHSYKTTQCSNNNNKSKSTFVKRNAYQIPESAKPQVKREITLEEKDKIEDTNEDDPNQKHIRKIEELILNGQNQKVEDFRIVQLKAIQQPKYIKIQRKMDSLLQNNCEVSIDNLSENNEEEENEQTNEEEQNTKKVNKDMITEHNINTEMNNDNYINTNETQLTKSKLKKAIDSHEYTREIRKYRQLPTMRDSEIDNNEITNSFRQSSSKYQNTNSSNNQQLLNVGNKYHYHDEDNNYLFSHSLKGNQPIALKEHIKMKKQKQRDKEESKKQKESEHILNIFKNLNNLQNKQKVNPARLREAHAPRVNTHQSTENLPSENSTEIDIEECQRELNDIKSIIALGRKHPKSKASTKEGNNELINTENDEQSNNKQIENNNTEGSVRNTLPSLQELNEQKNRKKPKNKHILEEEFIKKIDNTIKNAGENVENVKNFIRSSSSHKSIQTKSNHNEQSNDQLIKSIESENKQTTKPKENKNNKQIQDDIENDDDDKKTSIKVPSTINPSNLNSLPQDENEENDDLPIPLPAKLEYFSKLIKAIFQVKTFNDFIDNVSSYIESKENYEEKLDSLSQAIEFILLNQFKVSYITLMEYLKKKYMFINGIERLIFVIKFSPLNTIVDYYNYVSYLSELKKIVAPFMRLAFEHLKNNIYFNNEDNDEEKQYKLNKLNSILNHYKVSTKYNVFQLLKRCNESHINKQYQLTDNESEYTKIKNNFLELNSNNNKYLNTSGCSYVSAKTYISVGSNKNNIISEEQSKRLNQTLYKVMGNKVSKTKSKQRKPYSTKLLMNCTPEVNKFKPSVNPYSTPSPSTNKGVLRKVPIISETDLHDISAEKDDNKDIDEWHNISKPELSREGSGSIGVSPQPLNPFHDGKLPVSSIKKKQSDGDYSNDDSAFYFTEHKLEESENSLDIDAIRNDNSIQENIQFTNESDKQNETPIEKEIHVEQTPQQEEPHNNNTDDVHIEGINIIFTKKKKRKDNNNRYSPQSSENKIEQPLPQEQPIIKETTPIETNPPSNEERISFVDIIPKPEPIPPKPFMMPSNMSEEELAEQIANTLLSDIIKTEVQKPSKPLLHKKHSALHKGLDSSTSLQNSLISSGSFDSPSKLKPTLSNIAQITAQIANPTDPSNSIFMRTMKDKKRERNLNVYNDKIAPQFINFIQKQIDTNYDSIIDQLSIPYKVNGENLMNKIMLRDESIQTNKIIFENQNDINNTNFIHSDLIKEFEPINQQLRKEDNVGTDSYYDNILNQCLVDAANEIISKERKYGKLGEPLPWSSRTREIGFKYGKDGNSKRKLMSKVKNRLETLVQTKMGLIHENHEYLNREEIANDGEKKFIESIKEELVEEDDQWKVFEKDETQLKLLLSKIVMEQLLSEVVEILEHVQLSRKEPAKYQYKSIYACEDIPRLSFQNTTEIYTTNNDENDSINQ